MLPLQILIVVSSDPDPATGTRQITFMSTVIAFTVASVYEVALTAWFGQTIGKMIFGVRVVRAVDRGPVGLGGALVRWSLPAVFAVAGQVFGGTPFLAFLGAGLAFTVHAWAFVDANRQGFHDKAAGTLVVRSGPSAE